MMVRRVLRVSLLACWAGASVMVRAQDSSGSTLPAATQKAIEAAVAKELKAYGGKQSVPGAVVAVWAPGKGRFVEAIGQADLSPPRPMALDDKFRIGSNTKTFVVTVVLQLVDEKRLGLDDPVSKFDIGVVVPNADHITVRQLCEMRSGLLDAYHAPQLDTVNFTPQTSLSPQKLIAIAVANPPLFPPGARYNYSNTNYLLLGLIIEAVTHHSAADEIRDRILVPLKLTNTTFPTTDPAMPTPFSHGYGLDKAGRWSDSTVALPPSITWAAGVMISDVADMTRWVKAYVTGATISDSTQRQRLACLPTGAPGLAFGLGIGCSAGWYGYTGGIPGYNTGAYYLPSQGATIIAFVNSQREAPSPGVANSIVRDITQILFPENVAFPLKEPK